MPQGVLQRKPVSREGGAHRGGRGERTTQPREVQSARLLDRTSLRHGGGPTMKTNQKIRAVHDEKKNTKRNPVYRRVIPRGGKRVKRRRRGERSPARTRRVASPKSSKNTEERRWNLKIKEKVPAPRNERGKQENTISGTPVAAKNSIS